MSIEIHIEHAKFQALRRSKTLIALKKEKILRKVISFEKISEKEQGYLEGISEAEKALQDLMDELTNGEKGAEE